MGRNSETKYEDLQLKYIHQAKKIKKINDSELLDYLSLLTIISVRLPELFPEEFNPEDLYWAKVNLSSPKSYGKAIKLIKRFLESKIPIEGAAEVLGPEYRIVRDKRQDYNEALNRYKDIEERYLERLIDGQWKRYSHPKILDDYDKGRLLLIILKEHLAEAITPHFQANVVTSLKLKKEDEAWVREQKLKEKQENEENKRIKLNVVLKKVGLTPKQAEVILKESLDNKNLTNISKDLDISVTAVKKRKDKAWEKIRAEAKKLTQTRIPAAEELISPGDAFIEKLFTGKSGQVKKVEPSEKREEFLDKLVKGAEQ